MKNIFSMKSTVYSRFMALTAAALLVACSAATPDDKKAQLEKLKEQQADITKQVQQLEKDLAKENPGEPRKVKLKDVAVTEIAPVKFEHFVQTQGSVEAEDNVAVSPKSPGVVIQVYVTEGQHVSKGQALAQIDNSILVGSLESMRSQLDLAKTVFERQENLWKQKIGTEVQYLEAKSRKESLERQLNSLEEQNNALRIKSPINGTVDEVMAKAGEAVSPGLPAFRVVNISDLKLTAKISEAYSTQIKKGNKVKVTIPELNKDLESTVTFVGRTIDPLSRTFTVEIKLPSDKDLRPNMTGIVKIIHHTEASALVVPINAVQNVNEEKIVFVAETSGKNTVARKKVVQVVGVYNGQAQVTGINAGDKVVTFGYQGLNDGEFLKI